MDGETRAYVDEKFRVLEADLTRIEADRKRYIDTALTRILDQAVTKTDYWTLIHFVLMVAQATATQTPEQLTEMIQTCWTIINKPRMEKQLDSILAEEGKPANRLARQARALLNEAKYGAKWKPPPDDAT